MPLHSSSYFAGVATVIATITLGFGGGILMTDAFVGKNDNAPKLAERRSSPLSESAAPIIASVSNFETAPVPPAANTIVAAAPNPAPPVAVPQSQPTMASAPGPASSTALPIAAPDAASAPALAVAQPESRLPDEAMAKARDEDVRKALAAERRRVERRKWAERRTQEMRKIEELNAVAEKIKDAERERGPIIRSFVAHSPAIILGDD